MRFRLLNLALAAMLTLVPVAVAADQPTMLIMGEDADTDTVPRNSRIFTRVVAALQEQVQVRGFKVYDETALSKDITDPGRVRRTDAELLTLAERLGPPPIDVVLAFQIFASADTANALGISDLRIRVSGRMLNVATGEALGNYEVAYRPGELPPLPAQCDRECVIERVGDEARRIAADLGAVLATRLDQLSPVADAATLEEVYGAKVSCAGLTTAYEVSLRGFDNAEMNQINEHLISFSGYKAHRPLRSDSVQTDYWYETCGDFARLMQNLRLMAEIMNVEVRVASISNRLEVERLGPLQSR
ncbi:hypothetical protein GEU84_020300 [Fertoebacter nigrum]|uniref:Flagellar assembly protein T N-terminal domain-containing protein n=1 Tax=Fertoeibacter niger TaxID=2656921 RepID=A0A8X8H348_9RHOB|nr:hypothetical protein [Fertoeibacter niger]NUB46738.1 hypothetical protein [Fertoeibacter niger]